MCACEVKSLEGLVEAFRKEEVRESLIVKCVEQLQEEKVTAVCGPPYHPQSERYRRAGTRQRTLKTLAGKVHFRLAIVDDTENHLPVYPLLDYFGVGPYQRMCRDLTKASVGLSLRSTYGDAREDLFEASGICLSKSTLHRRVQETASDLEDHYRAAIDKVTCKNVEADGTKVHGLKGKNDVNVVVGVSNQTGEKVLLGLGVNRDWGEIKTQTSPYQAEDSVLIADFEPAIRQNLLAANQHFQGCIRHATGYVSYNLWSEKVPLKERQSIIKNMSRIMYTLKNSVLKHLGDQDMKALKERIEWTKQELKKLADEFAVKGYESAHQFIQNSANHLLTFAHLALKGQHVPWNNNLIERVMGEVAKRCKNKWMHWSTTGLENLLTFLLIKFTQPRLYEQFWQEYVGPPATLKFTLTIHKEETKVSGI